MQKEFKVVDNTIYITKMRFLDITAEKTGNVLIGGQFRDYRKNGMQILIVLDIEKHNFLDQINNKRAHFHDGQWTLYPMQGQIVGNKAVWGTKKSPVITPEQRPIRKINGHKVISGYTDGYAYAEVTPANDGIARRVIAELEKSMVI